MHWAADISAGSRLALAAAGSFRDAVERFEVRGRQCLSVRPGTSGTDDGQRQGLAPYEDYSQRRRKGKSDHPDLFLGYH